MLSIMKCWKTLVKHDHSQQIVPYCTHYCMVWVVLLAVMLLHFRRDLDQSCNTLKFEQWHWQTVLLCKKHKLHSLPKRKHIRRFTWSNRATLQLIRYHKGIGLFSFLLFGETRNIANATCQGESTRQAPWSPRTLLHGDIVMQVAIWHVASPLL